MLVGEVMNKNPATIHSSATLGQAAATLSRTRASDLAVLDENGTFLGVLSEGDVLRTLLPRFEEVVSGGGSLEEAFELFLRNGRFLADQPIGRIVIKETITSSPDDDLLQAATAMVSKQIRLLPVIVDHKLVGSVSRAEICLGALAGLGAEPAPPG